MGIKIFLALLLDLMILSNCLPLPGQIIKYKVPNKYFANETSQSLNSKIDPPKVSLLDLLTQVHYQGIPHPDVTKIQTADIQIEDVDAPIEEEIFNETLDFNFKNENVDDLKMAETTKPKDEDSTEGVNNDLSTKEDVKHVHVNVVKDETLSQFDELINKLVYDLSKSEDLLDAIKTNLDQKDNTLENSNMVIGSIEKVVNDNEKLTENENLSLRNEEEKIEITTELNESTESVTNQEDASINEESTESNVTEENTEPTYTENVTEDTESEEDTTEFITEPSTENVETYTESGTEPTVELSEDSTETSTTKMDTEQDSTTITPLNEESTQKINIEESPYTESIAKEIEKILLDVLREENADEELQLDSTRKTDESNDDFMTVVAQIHLKATASDEKEEKENSTEQPTNLLINQLNVETEHPSFDGETDEVSDPKSEVKPEFYEGETTEENLQEATGKNDEIMEVQDDLIDVVKEMPDGTLLSGDDLKIDTTTSVSISEEAKITEKVTESDTSPDEIIVMEIKDVVNDKDVDETSKLLQNVKNIIEMVEEQSLRNINNFKNVLRNPISHNSHQSFLDIKDEILHSDLNQDLFL